MTQATDKLLEIVQQQENALIFNKFDTEDAWEIGMRIRQKLMEAHAGAVVDISCNGIALFTACTEGTTPHNFTWVTRKRNTVLEYWKSSYRVMLELERSKKTLADRGLEVIRYAASGGGIPIRLCEGGVVGAVVISGMTQEEDHQFAVDAMCEYLARNVPSIRAQETV